MHFKNKRLIMKKFLITSLALVLGGTAALAQYADDPYANSGSGNRDEDRRSSTQGYQSEQQRYQNDRYSDNDNYYDEYNDGYIDYDDDSYTSRFRRFDGMYMGHNYWSPVFSPYWAMPVYMDPWFYSPYRMGGWGMGMGVGLGWGGGWGGPYWSAGWGMCNWWGFNQFSYWNNPYAMGGWGGYGMGWGGGFGAWNNGYWNGYYDGIGMGRRNMVNYGPRRSYSSNVGTGRTTGGVRPNPNGPRGDYQRRGSNMGINTGGNRPTRNGVNSRDGYIRERGNISNSRVERGNMDRNIRIDNNTRRTREVQGGRDMRVTPGRQMDVNPGQSTPSRNVTPRQSSPRQNFDRSSTPSRSVSPSAPSRSSGGGGFRGGGGGGSRGGGSFRR